MEISAEKTKLKTNNTSGINTEIKVNGQKLETVTRFKYLGSVITDEGSKPEMRSRIAQATADLTRLNKTSLEWQEYFRFKIQLMHSLVISIFLHACESRTLTAELQRRIQALEMRCYRKSYYTSNTNGVLLHISYKNKQTSKQTNKQTKNKQTTKHGTNGEDRAKIQQAIGPHEDT